jgi:hypothetical protein
VEQRFYHLTGRVKRLGEQGLALLCDIAKQRLKRQFFQAQCNCARSRIEVNFNQRTQQKGRSCLEITRIVIPSRDAGLTERDFANCFFDDHMKVRQLLEVWMLRNPGAIVHLDHCGSEASFFGSSGSSRAPNPKRKIVAAIRPMETPHSKIVGE